MWILYAVLSAIFASLVSILAKVGIKGVNSNLAVAIRTIVVLVMAWGIVFITGAQSGMKSLTRENVLFLVLSGLATGASWLFYYKAIQMGDVSKVAPIDKMSIVFTIVLAVIFLKEPTTFKSVIGAALITAGTFVMIL